MKNIDSFFSLARERYQIMLNRQAGQPAPWTDDEILRSFRFCNVFREDDATTIWIKENIREPLRDDPFVLVAMVVCRLFNRISTLERLKPMLLERRWDSTEARELLKDAKPLITAAYLVRSPQGMDKLTGLLWSIDQFYGPSTLRHAESMLEHQSTLRATTDWLAHFPSIGDFLAYEIVTDLRHTALLENAPDIVDWANPGPGAARGLARLKDGDVDVTYPKDQMIQDMRDILEMSRNPDNWPAEWPQWEMREVEHTLCEFDKYERTRLGEGTPKQKYEGGGGSMSLTDRRSIMPKVAKDPIEELVNRKIQGREQALQQELVAIVEQHIDNVLEQHKETLSSLPENFLPLVDRVSLHRGQWDGGVVLLTRPRRLPAFLVEQPILLSVSLDEFRTKLEELKTAKAELHQQLKDLLES